MTSRQIWWTAAGVLSAAALVAAFQQAPSSARGVIAGPVTGVWKDSDAPRRIRQLAAPIERMANWPGLGNYLAAISYTESRGNPRAGSDAQNNAARGWFGIRPKSGKLDKLGLGVEALKDERTAVALAAWYAERCQKYAYDGQVMDWLSVRRCWGFPKDVPKVNHPGYSNQLSVGLSKVGLPSNFMYRPAFPPGFRWPGIDAVLAAVGRPRVA